MTIRNSCRRLLQAVGLVGLLLLGVTGAFDRGSPQLAGAAGAGTPGGEFFPVAPLRVLDTRYSIGASGPVTGTVTARVTGFPAIGVPVSGVLAVALNVTITQPSSAGYATTYPAGAGTPLASNHNFGAGQTVANLVVVGVGPNGLVSTLVSSGSAHVIYDLVGWYASSSSSVGAGVGSRLYPVQPQRLLDSRTGVGRSGSIGPGETIELQVAGRVQDRSGSAAGGITAVVLNLTGTEPNAATYLTAFPEGSVPTASNLNLVTGQTRPNQVMVKVGSDGKIRIFNAAGRVHLLADVVGFYRAGAAPSTFEGRVVPLSAPYRAFDTRTTSVAVGPQEEDTWSFADFASTLGVGNLSGLVMNLTSTQSSQPSYLTMYPADVRRPNTSNLNLVAGQNIPNLAVVSLGRGGATNQVNAFNSEGFTHYLADVSAVILAD